MKIKNIYEVKWIDTFETSAGWKDVEDIIQTAKEHSLYITTVGFYVGLSNGYEIFASELNISPLMKDYAGLTFIPKGCIKKIKQLK